MYSQKVIKRFVELKQRTHITYLERQDFVIWKIFCYAKLKQADAD